MNGGEWKGEGKGREWKKEGKVEIGPPPQNAGSLNFRTNSDLRNSDEDNVVIDVDGDDETI